MPIQNIKYTQPVTGTASDNPTLVEGITTVQGQSVVLIADVQLHQLCESILIELKKHTLLLQEITETEVYDEDVT